jgi:hypothetical protein
MEVVKIKGADKKLRCYIFKVPLYEMSYKVYIGKNLKASIDACELDYKGLDLKLDHKFTDAYAGVVNHFSNGEEFIMLLSPDVSRGIDGIIAHESLHLAWYITDYCDIQCDPDNHEALAYVLTHIVNNVHKAMNNYNKKFSK